MNEVVEKWEMCPLEIPRKALKFFVQKRVKGYETRELRKNVSNNTESEVSLRGTYILGCANNSQNPSDTPFHTVPTSLHPAARAWLSLAQFWRFREKLCMNRSSSLLNMQSLHVAKILVLSQDLIAIGVRAIFCQGGR